MAGTTLDIRDFISPDQLAISIANKYIEWHDLRTPVIANWEEVRKYVYATDTTQTSNSTLPWKNKTTIPKLAQIRENLFANLKLSLFPRRGWLSWHANTKDANSRDKRDAILMYMNWVVSQPQFQEEFDKVILDYIDYGNPFVTADWVDQRREQPLQQQSGYVGPAIRRISPFDIVFNPIASSFIDSPKIVRSFITIGELKKKLDQMSTDEDRDAYEELFKYLVDYRQMIRQHSNSDLEVKDGFLRMDGFTSYRAYIDSDYVELLTFYGDMYDYEKEELLPNHVIIVADKHKIVAKKPNPSFLGYPPIFNAGWRPRQDNLWAMGPLENLLGLQYRIDHIENLKADVFDLIAFPVLKIKGQVQDFEWGPMQRIYTMEDSDVEMLAPPFQILQANTEIEILSNIMEAMAGAPKEALGFRTPGEKTAYEISRLENAAARIFQMKAMQLEALLERVLNACLDIARRHISGAQEINVFDDELKIQTFLTITADDIAGAGQIKPIGAKHFAEKAELVQNLNNFYSSAVGQDELVKAHFSALKTAQMSEDLLDLQRYEVVQPYVRLGEQMEAQRLMAAGQEQMEMTIQTPSGITEDDSDVPLA